MFLERLRLTNFKCFAHEQIEFGKITLLLGPNSSGKSSLLYALLAALQSDQFPITLSVNGELVNLGDFRSIAHNHRPEKEITVGLEFCAEDNKRVQLEGAFSYAAPSRMPELVACKLVGPALSIQVEHGREKYSASWSYMASKDTFHDELEGDPNLKRLWESIAAVLRSTIKDETAKKKSGVAKAGQESSTELPVDLFHVPPTGQFTFGRPPEFFRKLRNPRHVALGTQLSTLEGATRHYLNSFNYVGSFRLEPQRTYYQVSKGNLKVRRDGGNYIEQISEWQESKAPELTQLKKAAARLTLASGIRANRLQNGQFEIRVRPHPEGAMSSLADVGFGIGQLLPILVADVQLPKGGTLAMSQPEIHLHPSVQAELAEYVAARATKNMRRYIIETHSEYFLNRLRYLVAARRLSAEDVAILYLQNHGTKTTTHKITILEDGRIEGAPDEFFKTYMSDVMNIAIAATK